MIDTILPAYAAVLESITRSTPPGGDPSEHLRVTAWILGEMTDTFLMLAFANACDACDDAGTPHPYAPGPGGNFADHPEPSPEVLTEAQAAAVKLYAAILAAPGGYDPAPAILRWTEHNAVPFCWRTQASTQDEAAARCWGHYAVMSARGHGVGWEDDNAPLMGGRERPGLDELPPVGDLPGVHAEDITWSDAPTDAARAVLDAREGR